MKVFKIIEEDEYLSPYHEDVKRRYDRYLSEVDRIKKEYGDLKSYANWHEFMGFHKEKDYIVYREWAPNADQLHLIGDFNDWDRSSYPLTKREGGIWEIKVKAKEIKDRSKVKVAVTANGLQRDRIPAFIKTTYQDPSSHTFSGVLWLNSDFKWTDDTFKVPKELFIYESHVGMATEEYRVGKFREFANNILPYIKSCNYNCIQLMAVMEHPYYGSFGYHVSNIYAVSSRFGTPDDLKYLVNKAHELGIAVVIDIVHSHAVKNMDEGLNNFDGTNYQYFHEGTRGFHSLWDSLLYNYAKHEVQRFLLSSIRYWLEEYHIDGFRFDGITSMLYHHHGLGIDFTHYEMYFDCNVDEESLLYLQLATSTAKEVNPQAVCIAEDMSGMPGLCRKIKEGGIGFDYRLGMGIPDLWIKTFKEQKDEEWAVEKIYYELTSRRTNEKTVAYTESHDQAIVGDKTIAFWLMDQSMYWHMDKTSQCLIIDRGVALHKMIRCLTMCFGGESYLNFMGNEFGHPEWIDFPREGNQFSYQYARRQWSIRENKQLKYQYLGNFDRELIALVKKEKLLREKYSKIISMDVHNHVVVLLRGKLLFVLSFNPNVSLEHYYFGVPLAGQYRLVLSSDDSGFGGHQRVDTKIKYFSQNVPMHGYDNALQVYVTNRTVLIFKLPGNKKNN